MNTVEEVDRITRARAEVLRYNREELYAEKSTRPEMVADSDSDEFKVRSEVLSTFNTDDGFHVLLRTNIPDGTMYMVTWTNGEADFEFVAYKQLDKDIHPTHD